LWGGKEKGRGKKKPTQLNKGFVGKRAIVLIRNRGKQEDERRFPSDM